MGDASDGRVAKRQVWERLMIMIGIPVVECLPGVTTTHIFDVELDIYAVCWMSGCRLMQLVQVTCM